MLTTRTTERRWYELSTRNVLPPCVTLFLGPPFLLIPLTHKPHPHGLFTPADRTGQRRYVRPCDPVGPSKARMGCGSGAADGGSMYRKGQGEEVEEEN